MTINVETYLQKTILYICSTHFPLKRSGQHACMWSKSVHHVWKIVLIDVSTPQYRKPYKCYTSFSRRTTSKGRSQHRERIFIGTQKVQSDQYNLGREKVWRLYTLWFEWQSLFLWSARQACWLADDYLIVRKNFQGSVTQLLMCILNL